MRKDYKEILETITTEQWEAIAVLATEKAKATSVPEVREPDEASLNKRVSDILRDLNVPANLKGYPYIRYAIVLAYRDREYVESITKILYPEVAARFNTTSSRAERAIRHAIEVAWDRGDIKELTKIFNWNPQIGKPTNSEFIAYMAEYLHNNS